MDWNLVNPWARDPEKKKKKKKGQDEEEQEKPPVPTIAYTYMTRVIFITMIFAVLGGIGGIIIFHGKSARFLFGMLAVLVFLATLVFGAALYISLGFLQRTALAAKHKKEEENKRIEPPEEWEMPKRRERA